MFFWRTEQENARRKLRKPLYEGRPLLSHSITRFFTVFLGIALVVGSWVGVRHLKALSLSELQIAGQLNHLTREDIAALSGLQSGQNLFSIDLEVVSANLMKHPWIYQVRLKRIFPDTIRIEVVEQNPVAVLRLDHFYLVNHLGKIFVKAETSEVAHFPVITGFAQSEFEKMPQLSGERFHETFKWLGFFSAQSFYKDDPISEIHFDAVLGYTVTTLNSGVEIHYGKDSIEEKQTKLEKFVRSIEFKNHLFSRLDLDLKGRVVARRF